MTESAQIFKSRNQNLNQKRILRAILNDPGNLESNPSLDSALQSKYIIIHKYHQSQLILEGPAAKGQEGQGPIGFGLQEAGTS